MPFVNVKDFGAKGDGKTDDRKAIQRAIDEAARRVGFRVRFPPGVYRLSGEVDGSDVPIDGEDDDR